MFATKSRPLRLLRPSLSPSLSLCRALSSGETAAGAGAVLFKGVSSEGGIREASFKLARGAKVALMGGDEAAKAHMLKLLSGELQASSGVISHSAGRNVVRFQPTISKEWHIYSVKSFLEQNMSPEDLKNSSAVVSKVMERVRLGPRLERRTINTLNASQHARLQLAVALLKSPDVLLLDHPTSTKSGPLSHDDVQDLSSFVSNFSQTCVVNSTDEDFLESFTDTVLNIDAQGRVEKFTGSYSAAKQVIENRVRAELSRAMDDKYRARPVQDSKGTYEKFAAAEAELDALNEIGFANTKTPDEEYIRLMMLLMAMHPPLILALYHAGAFDAIL